MEEVDTFRRKIIPDNFVQCIRYLDEKTCGNFVIKTYRKSDVFTLRIPDTHSPLVEELILPAIAEFKLKCKVRRASSQT